MGAARDWGVCSGEARQLLGNGVHSATDGSGLLAGKDSLEMPFALNLIYAAALVDFLAALVLPMASRREVSRRAGLEKLLGKAPLRIGEHPCLWFHSVSVGEVLLLRPLVQEMARRRPNWQVVISTSTSTGLAVARRAYPDLVTFYAPLDFSWATRRAIARFGRRCWRLSSSSCGPI